MVVRLYDQVKNWTHPRVAPSESPYVVVGLGNPGPKYAAHRHNVGFQCVDRIAVHHGIAIKRRRFHSLLGEGVLAGRRVILAQPQTFMNDSGKAVAPLCRWYKTPPQRLLVIYDDLDLPLGRVRLRPGGSSGGHRGIESLIAALGTSDFARLRVGIGRPLQGDPIDYVLNDFGRDQEPVIARAYELVEQAVLCFLEEGIKEAMNAFNGLDR